MVRNIEVVTVDSPNAKLTITKERVTIKIPTTTTLVDTERVVKFFKKVADEHPSPELSLRAKAKPVADVFVHGIELGTGGGNKTPRKMLNSYKFDE